MKAEAVARADLEKRVESLERDLTRAGQESRAQSARAASLQRQLDGGGGSARGMNGFDDVAEGVATADIMALKVKATQLVDRLRQEKATRLKAERKTQKVAGKVRECVAITTVSHEASLEQRDMGPCRQNSKQAGRQAGM